MNSLCVEISIFLAIFIVVFIIISPRLDSLRKHTVVHIWFVPQIACMLMSLIISSIWLSTGKDPFFYYGDLWNLVERGTLKSLSSVVGIIGVSSLLLGWAYGERDKRTLGKPQIDIIHYRYGTGYGLSIIVHFVATALCMILIECQAREATLWAFVTVIAGCVPQAAICLQIVFNQKNREDTVQALWREEAHFPVKKKKAITDPWYYHPAYIPSKIKNRLLNRNYAFSSKGLRTILDMASHLSDFEVVHHNGYQETIAEILFNWAERKCNITLATCGVTEKRIEKLSAVFRELFERIPKEERPFWEESLLKKICKKVDMDTSKGKAIANLLAASYIHYLYCKSPDETNFRIHKIKYYSNHQSDTYQKFCCLTKSFFYGLTWYAFLDCRTGLPSSISCENTSLYYINGVFEKMIFAIYHQCEPEDIERAKIAWSQV